jgi:hypothetical protein
MPNPHVSLDPEGIGWRHGRRLTGGGGEHRCFSKMAASNAKPRWFHPTPGRLVAILLILECLLWLSACFQCFAYDEKKGWAMLIAVAAFGVAILLMVLWLIVALVFRMRFQFSIRTLLGLMVAVAIPSSWLTVDIKKAKEQRDAVARIEESGGQVSWSQPFEPAWLRSVLGDDFDRLVLGVDLHGTQITDAGLDNLKAVHGLIFLNLCETNVTDSALENLKRLNRLQVLYLGETKTTDAGLEYVEPLHQLQQLDLRYTTVTDVGLEHLKSLDHLQVLNLARTNVTDAGVKKLQQALPTCHILR